jgi:hypothetical protein
VKWITGEITALSRPPGLSDKQQKIFWALLRIKRELGIWADTLPPDDMARIIAEFKKLDPPVEATAKDIEIVAGVFRARGCLSIDAPIEFGEEGDSGSYADILPENANSDAEDYRFLRPGGFEAALSVLTPRERDIWLRLNSRDAKPGRSRTQGDLLVLKEDTPATLAAKWDLSEERIRQLYAKADSNLQAAIRDGKVNAPKTPLADVPQTFFNGRRWHLTGQQYRAAQKYLHLWYATRRARKSPARKSQPAKHADELAAWRDRQQAELARSVIRGRRGKELCAALDVLAQWWGILPFDFVLRRPLPYADHVGHDSTAKSARAPAWGRAIFFGDGRRLEISEDRVIIRQKAAPSGRENLAHWLRRHPHYQSFTNRVSPVIFIPDPREFYVKDFRLTKACSMPAHATRSRDLSIVESVTAYERAEAAYYALFWMRAIQMAAAAARKPTKSLMERTVPLLRKHLMLTAAEKLEMKKPLVLRLERGRGETPPISFADWERLKEAESWPQVVVGGDHVNRPASAILAAYLEAVRLAHRGRAKHYKPAHRHVAQGYSTRALLPARGETRAEQAARLWNELRGVKPKPGAPACGREPVSLSFFSPWVPTAARLAWGVDNKRWHLRGGVARSRNNTVATKMEEAYLRGGITPAFRVQCAADAGIRRVHALRRATSGIRRAAHEAAAPRGGVAQSPTQPALVPRRYPGRLRALNGP